MASNNTQITKDAITEGLFNSDYWNPFDSHLISYFKSPIQSRFVSSKTGVIGRALRHAVVDFLDHILNKSNEYIENDTTVIGTEYRLYHTRHYTFPVTDNEYQYSENDDKIELEISSLAPTVFSQLREDIGISNKDFRQSYSKHHLKDFTNPGKSGSLMYKTYDDLFILKTLKEYEARLLMQILSGYHLQLSQRPTILNRYVGLYSIRFLKSISTIEIYVVIMVNAFTPSLQINEIFDLKGSTIKRKIEGHLSKDKLDKLKDLDFLDLYPNGIRIPDDIYRNLHLVISNDVKVLRKLCITDFSLILGIRHLDITVDELMRRRPSTGVSALLHMSHNFALLNTGKFELSPSSSISSLNITSPVSYLKPLEMLRQHFNKHFYYDNDEVGLLSLPIPGIVTNTDQRVYLYLAIVDILQTYDSIKYIEQTLKKITDHTRHHQYSVIEPDEYEKRIMKFLFENVFVNAGNDFPWNKNGINDNNYPQTLETINSVEEQNLESDDIVEFRL